MEEKHKIKVRADMFCKLFAASCGVKDGELFEISKSGNHLEFKVKIHHVMRYAHHIAVTEAIADLVHRQHAVSERRA